MSAPARLRVPFRPTLLALLCSLTVTAHAAEEDNKALVLDNVNINAQAPTPNALPPVYSGGQVARGGQVRR